jgi:hypothetical protein
MGTSQVVHDPLNKSGEIQVNILPPIPTFLEHEVEVSKLWKICRWLAIGIFVVISVITAIMFMSGMDPEKAVAISTIAFQAILLSYGMGFFVPALLTSLKRLGLSVHMMYESLRLGQQAADKMKDLHDRAIPVFSRGEKLIENLEPIIEVANQQAQDGYLEKIEAHMKAIREAIERQTPLSTKSRTIRGEP